MTLVFPDTTVLVSFAHMGRMDLFAELVTSRGTWTITIAQEVGHHSGKPGMEGLHRVSGILGEPVIPTQSERADAFALRTRLARPGDPKHSHQGEAETIAVMRSRVPDGILITDDLSAADLARSPDVGIRVYGTGDLIRLAVKSKLIDLDTAWEMIDLLRPHGRARGMPLAKPQLSQWIFDPL